MMDELVTHALRVSRTLRCISLSVGRKATRATGRPKMITSAARRAMAAAIRSYRPGRTPSTARSQTSEAAM